MKFAAFLLCLAPLASTAQMMISPAEQAARDSTRQEILMMELRTEVEGLQNSASKDEAIRHRQNIAALTQEMNITTATGAAVTANKKTKLTPKGRWCDAFCKGRNP